MSRRKILTILQFFILFTLITVGVVGHYNHNGKTLKCKMESRDTVIVYREIPHVDTLFNHDYLDGDTACFELINPNTDSIDIRLRCVCDCEEYKKKKNVQ